MAVGAGAAIVMGAIYPLWAVAYGEIIQGLYDNADNSQILKISLGFLGLAIVAQICAFFQNSFLSISASIVAKELRQKVFWSLIQQEVAFFDENSTGNLIGHFTTEVATLENVMSDKTGNLIQSFFTTLFGISVALFYGWELSLVLLSLMPIIFIPGLFNLKVLARIIGQTKGSLSTASSLANEVISSFKTVTSFERENYFIQKFQSLLAKRSDLTRKTNWIGFGFGLTFLTIFCVNGLGFWIGGTWVADGILAPGRMLIIFNTTITACNTIARIFQLGADFASGEAASEKIWQVIDRTPRFTSGSQKLPENFNPSLKFEGVSFSYPQRPDVPVLSDISFEVVAGKVVAFVGRSGCGKTTIISLIQRFYDPSSGSISIDGVNIERLEIDWLRSQFALVSQEPVLFALSIRENIRFGRLSASEDEIVEAAQFANAHNFIVQLPEGYDTHVGERGTQLSGGQKQRVAIARAILKSPPFLLLDEATSALDSESERLVQDALDKLMKNCTTLVVAHRLSTIQNADRILVLNEGKIIEEGTHDGLISQEGMYCGLVKGFGREKRFESG
eukprot:TRINITY_DN946_c0_g1_i1.p1 TRINITY_DN946_c0_g1~~TRINITY_DN946_c0_g1_i1.p1  ORF type:complete len:592 (+),score=147.34 TRINITY_DN946_c0_g1_i1:89-1777(+)